MSDSELSEASATPVPPDAQLERSLRREVHKAQQMGEEFSINSIRAASEASLGLAEGFYLNSDEWKGRSKDVIRDQNDSGEPVPKSPDATRPDKKRKPATKSTGSKKRASVDAEPASRKKQKHVPQSESASESELSTPPSVEESSNEQTSSKSRSNGSKAAVKSSETKSKSRVELDSEDSADNGVGSGSELSVLLDENGPPKKKKSKDATTSKRRGSKATTDDPDLAEIKRLQGWLVKCGVRKLWGKELKPYETQKAKIKHLKDMLTEVGMTGRYSQEKAAQIREARELAADIEAVQEGAERWGADEDETGREGERPRRLIRGAKNYDFLSSDGEETD